MRTTLAVLTALIFAIGEVHATAPPAVDWRDAGEYAGQVATVEGDVLSAHCAEDTCALEFAPDDPHGFRVVVLMPMFSRATDPPDRMYTGRRIRATGKLQRFQGRVEMVVRGTGQVELADVRSTTSTVVTPVAPRPTYPPPTVPPPAPATPGAGRSAPPPVPPPAVAPAPTLPAPQPTAKEPPAPPSPPAGDVPPAAPPAGEDAHATASASCGEAKARWRQAASDVRARTAALDRCFRALPYHCRVESAALAVSLPTLDEAERQADEACR